MRSWQPAGSNHAAHAGDGIGTGRGRGQRPRRAAGGAPRLERATRQSVRESRALRSAAAAAVPLPSPCASAAAASATAAASCSGCSSRLASKSSSVKVADGDASVAAPDPIERRRDSVLCSISALRAVLMSMAAGPAGGQPAGGVAAGCRGERGQVAGDGRGCVAQARCSRAGSGTLLSSTREPQPCRGSQCPHA